MKLQPHLFNLGSNVFLKWVCVVAPPPSLSFPLPPSLSLGKWKRHSLSFSLSLSSPLCMWCISLIWWLMMHEWVKDGMGWICGHVGWHLDGMYESRHEWEAWGEREWEVEDKAYTVTQHLFGGFMGKPLTVKLSSESPFPAVTLLLVLPFAFLHTLTTHHPPPTTIFCPFSFLFFFPFCFFQMKLEVQVAFDP